VRAVVCAYGEVGHACLRALLDRGATIGLVVTHDDSPTENIWYSSVRALAVSAGVPVVTTEDVDSTDVVAAVRAASPEYLFSFYFRKMIGPTLLAVPRVAALNLHGSLLPRYRGRAPVNWVLIHGETETGVTLHHMDERPDHGDIVAQRRVAITREDDALSLTRKLAREGARLIGEMYPLLAAGAPPRTPQDHARATSFGRRRPEDGRIDWRRSAEEIRNLVRAVSDPWPGAFAVFGGRKLLIWGAETRPAWDGAMPGEIVVDRDGSPLVATGEGALEIRDVTWEGESRRSGRDWAHGAVTVADARFDEPRPGAGGGGA